MERSCQSYTYIFHVLSWQTLFFFFFLSSLFEKELSELMRAASNNRAVAATGMNAGSSRSHSVTIIRIFQKDTQTGSTKTGKLCLVDLAGSGVSLFEG